MRNDIIAGLDIGSTAIRLAVGQIGEDRQAKIIGAVSAPSAGISKASVRSIEDLISALSAVLEKSERIIGLPVASVFVGLNSPNIKCEKSKGVVAVGKSDGEVQPEDVERAIEAARALSVPPNYEILHVIPVKFTVDSQEDIKDPVGMTGVRLEVECLIIQGLSTQVKNLTKAIYRTGLDIDDLVLSPLAAAEAVVGPKQKELGAALVNIGSSTTSLAVYEEGELLHTAVIPLGSEHITADVAIGLRCPINLAERIKVEYGSAWAERINKKDELDISGLAAEEGAGDEFRRVNRRYLAEIIEARVEEIFDKVDAELKRIDRSGMLPGGVFLTGGGTRLADILEAAKAKLRLPAALGQNTQIPAIIDRANDTEFINALGLVAWGAKVGSGPGAPGGQIGAKLKDVFGKLGDFFKGFKP